MKVGIFVYSQSGHTASFARAIADRLKETKIDYDIELISPYGIPKPWTGNISFRNIPEVKEYDILLFGGPVWFFGISKVLRKFFAEMDSIKGKTVIPFVTCGFSASFGANRALKQIEEEVSFFQAEVLEGEALSFVFSITNKEKMREAVERIINKIKGIILT